MNASPQSQTDLPRDRPPTGTLAQETAQLDGERVLALARHIWYSMRRKHPELATRLEQDDAIQEAALYILTHPDVPLKLGFVSARWHLVKLATREQERHPTYGVYGAEEVEELPEASASTVAVGARGVSGAWSSPEIEGGVETHVKPLPPPERFVILATYYGFKRAEIAASLHVSERTVSRLLSQALAMLGIRTARKMQDVECKMQNAKL